MKVRALRLLARATDERRVVATELGGGVHGGRALTCVRAEEERQGERKRVREARRHTGARFWSSRARGGAWHGGWTRVGHVGALCGAWLPRRPFVKHVVRVAVLDLEAVIGMLVC